METETEKKSNSKLSWLIILLLIIIIIILLFFLRIGRTNEKYLVPTGNVDVFNIDTVCKCKKCKDVNGDQTDIEPPYDIPTYNEKTDKDIIGELFVDDKNGNFLFQQNLRIFENAAYKFENKIAPGVSNTYQFVIHNSSNVNVKYDILMYEESEYQINMKYRLKKNDKYIIGNGDKVVRQSPVNGDVITNQDTIYLITNDANLVVPNVVGLSGKVAKDLLQKMGLIVHLDGVGYVTSQSVGEGTPITEGMEVTLQLAPKYSVE